MVVGEIDKRGEIQNRFQVEGPVYELKTDVMNTADLTQEHFEGKGRRRKPCMREPPALVRSDGLTRYASCIWHTPLFTISTSEDFVNQLERV